MKKILLTVIVLFITNTTFGQDLKSLELETKKMINASTKLNFEEILDYTYPKLFEIISKEQMKEVLKATFSNEQFGISFLNIEPDFQFRNITKIENKTLCVIKYKLGMAMHFNETVDEQTVSTMIQTLESQGEAYQEVKFDKEKNTFFIKGISTMIGIVDELTNNKWKFITYDKNQKQLNEMLLSATILNKLGL